MSSPSFHLVHLPSSYKVFFNISWNTSPRAIAFCQLLNFAFIFQKLFSFGLEFRVDGVSFFFLLAL